MNVPHDAQRPPGWYPDPWSQGPVRWWNGKQWAAAPYMPPTKDWRRWFIASPTSLQICRWLYVADAVAMSLVGCLFVYTLVVQRPLAALATLLVIPGALLLLWGQIWMIAIKRARKDAALSQSAPTPTLVNFGQRVRSTHLSLVPRVARGGLEIASIVAVVVALSGFVTLSGNADHLHAQIGAQRVVLGVFMMFYSVHCGFALSEVIRRADNTQIDHRAQM